MTRKEKAAFFLLGVGIAYGCLILFMLSHHH
jgi:hypothetical protein